MAEDIALLGSSPSHLFCSHSSTYILHYKGTWVVQHIHQEGNRLVNLQLLHDQVVGRMPVVVVVEISVMRGGCASNGIHVVTKCPSPALLLPRKSFVEER